MPPDSFLDNFDYCDYFQELRPLFVRQVVGQVLEKVRELYSFSYEEKDNKLYVKKKVNILKNE